MHRQRYSYREQPKKPSRLLVLTALLVACLLPFLLIKTFFGKKHSDVAHETLTLPEQPKVNAPTQQPATLKAEKKSVISKPVEKTKIIEKVPPVVEKKTTETIKSKGEQWINLTTRSGDSMATLFKRAGLSNQILFAVLQKNSQAKLLTRIKPGQSLRFLIKNNQLERMIFDVGHGQLLEVVHENNHYKTILSQPKSDSRERYVTATVQYSLYSTAKRHNIPYKLIQQMTDIFKREINFAKDVRGGDRFTIIYKASYVDNQPVGAGDIIAVTYTHRGISHQALRHVNAAGVVEYFTPDGQSLKQGFSRYPIKFSHINSSFSLSRMHPILHYHRPHKGVDLAAPMGTPILATGDGRVQHLGYENGYGNVIKITHHNALYTSVYAHLLKFKKGIFKGSYVKRGQVIGYVGQSGLASGPHCHYEFHVNHRPRNPSTVPLPHAEPVPSRDMAAFKAHADKLIAHLKLFEQAHLASKKNSNVG